MTFRLFLVATLPLVAQPGKAIFEGKGGCIRCHSVDGRGGSLGPDLSEIGLHRTPDSLRQSITNPDAEIAREYLTVVVTPKAGAVTEGVALNEDDISIQVRDKDGTPRSFRKDSLKSVNRFERSLMPSYAGKLSASETDQLVAYLGSLRGEVEPPEQKRRPGPITTSTVWMDRANRDAQERPEMLLDNLKIQPGATVVDLGAGTGYFTTRLAKRVGDQGRVIAVDIQQSMLDKIAEHHLRNVQLALGTEDDPRLPANSADLVLIANAYHEFSQPAAMMSAVGRCLKPNGRVVVTEYSEESDEGPTAGVYTMTRAQIRSEIEAMGFRLERILDFLPMQHGLIFVKQ